MNAITYAVGDVHGRSDLLLALLEAVEGDAASHDASAIVVFLGDYVDRGPDSKGVIDVVSAGPRRPGDRWIALKGNHDHMLVEAFGKATSQGLDWMAHFGTATIASYGLDRMPTDPRKGYVPAELRKALAWIEALPLFHDDGERFFVHAGIVTPPPGRPCAPMHRQPEDVYLWIREGFLEHEEPLERLVVHGHTIMGDLPVVNACRVSVDTGAYRSDRLTAAVFDPGVREPRFLQTLGPTRVQEVMASEPQRKGPTP